MDPGKSCSGKPLAWFTKMERGQSRAVRLPLTGEADDLPHGKGLHAGAGNGHETHVTRELRRGRMPAPAGGSRMACVLAADRPGIVPVHGSGQRRLTAHSVDLVIVRQGCKKAPCWKICLVIADLMTTCNRLLRSSLWSAGRITELLCTAVPPLRFLERRRPPCVQEGLGAHAAYLSVRVSFFLAEVMLSFCTLLRSV